MLLHNLHHRGIPILAKLQPALPVDAEEASKHLRRKVQHIPIGFNIILRVDGKQFRAIGKRLDLFLALGQLHPTGRTAQCHHSISCTDSLKTIEIPVKPEHVIIGLQFQHMSRPVGFTHLKDSHGHRFIAAVCQPQVIGQFHLCILQRVPVNIKKQADSHLRRIHRTKLNLRIAAALSRDIAAAFYDILLREGILHTGHCRNLSCPVNVTGVPLHRLQERLTYRVHRTPLLPFSGIKKAPIISD